MAWVISGKHLQNQWAGTTNGVIDLDTDTIKVMLLTNTEVPATDADDFIDDFVANEVAAGSSYSAGGPPVSRTVSGPASGVVTIDMADVVIAQDASGFTNARYAVLYKDSGVDSTSPIFAWADFGADKSIVGGSLTLAIDAAGIFTVT